MFVPRRFGASLLNSFKVHLFPMLNLLFDNHQILREDGGARRGRIHFKRGNWTAETPAFMSVGTVRTVICLSTESLREGKE